MINNYPDGVSSEDIDALTSDPYDYEEVEEWCKHCRQYTTHSISSFADGPDDFKMVKECLTCYTEEES